MITATPCLLQCGRCVDRASDGRYRLSRATGLLPRACFRQDAYPAPSGITLPQAFAEKYILKVSLVKPGFYRRNSPEPASCVLDGCFQEVCEGVMNWLLRFGTHGKHASGFFCKVVAFEAPFSAGRKARWFEIWRCCSLRRNMPNVALSLNGSAPVLGNLIQASDAMFAFAKIRKRAESIY